MRAQALVLPQNAATPQNIQISNVERLCCSARRRRQLERHFNLFRFQKETSPGPALLTLPPTEARTIWGFSLQELLYIQNPKKIVLDFHFEFQSQPLVDKVWMEVAATWYQIEVFKTEDFNNKNIIRDEDSTALYAVDRVYTFVDTVMNIAVIAHDGLWEHTA